MLNETFSVIFKHCEYYFCMCVASSFFPLVFFAASISEAKDITRAQFANRKKNPMNYFFGFLTLENQSLNNSVGHGLLLHWEKIYFRFLPCGNFFFTVVAVLTLPLPEAISKSILTFLAVEYAPSSLLSHGIRWENVKLNVTTFKREHSISQSSTYWSSRPPSTSKVKQN